MRQRVLIKKLDDDDDDDDENHTGAFSKTYIEILICSAVSASPVYNVCCNITANLDACKNQCILAFFS